MQRKEERRFSSENDIIIIDAATRTYSQTFHSENFKFIQKLRHRHCRLSLISLRASIVEYERISVSRNYFLLDMRFEKFASVKENQRRPQQLGTLCVYPRQISE